MFLAHTFQAMAHWFRKWHIDVLGYGAIVTFTLEVIPITAYGDVTIAGEGLQNLGLCSALRAFEQGGILAVTWDLGFSSLILLPMTPKKRQPKKKGSYTLYQVEEILCWWAEVIPSTPITLPHQHPTCTYSYNNLNILPYTNSYDKLISLFAVI